MQICRVIVSAPLAGIPLRLWRGTAVLGLLATILVAPAAGGQSAGFRPGRADFTGEAASTDARHVADWVAYSGDNGGLPFLIVDKANARVFVFEPGGRLRGAAPALLGSARGDHSIPGIGERPMSRIRPHERTTPAGRFVAEQGRNLQGEDIVWIDYDSAVSLHRVRATNPRERRLERLASPTPADNRISYGCINVPAAFYDNVVRPAFSGAKGIVYVLPEVRAVREVFGSYGVEGARLGGSHSTERPHLEPVSARP